MEGKETSEPGFLFGPGLLFSGGGQFIGVGVTRLLL